MTRLWSQGELIRVDISEAGTPTAFDWQNVHHPVEKVANHWKVDTGWWIVRTNRNYWKLCTTTGLLVVVFCNLVDGQWYLQRLYD